MNNEPITPVWKTTLILIWRIISITLWAMLILIVISSFGRYFAFGEVLTPESTKTTLETPISTSSNTLLDDKFKRDINIALTAAYESAIKTAKNNLDLWNADLMSRVDNPGNNNDFLDWYFGYWTQQKLGLEGSLQAATHFFNQNALTAKEKIQEEVLTEFTNQVLRPEIAKLEFKNICRNIAEIYTSELQKNLENIRVKYSIPESNWNEYLNSITVVVTNTNGRQFPLKLKAFTIGGLGATTLLTKVAVVAIEKVTAQVGTKVILKAGASFLSKASAIAGGELLGPAVTVVIIVWDAIDIHNTEAVYRPILKESIEKYFTEMTKDILSDEENGIQKVIYDIEASIRRSFTNSRVPILNYH
ncbi:MAG: hypothetical protein EAZ76_06195 [Nostocales cyanobacterium]|nr:MAG: hypothetical protein EAZ87_05000 [Nostocales cyanobacterium]TAF17125.1 MAG: hypothetical protein EAZ76_06195 [Nostocales cyanobacterium]